MKTNILLTFVAFLCLGTSLTFAQEAEEEEVLVTDQDKFITLSQINAITPQASSSVANGTNAVFIQQIGTDNVVLANIAAESSDIKIFQQGNENSVAIEETAREIEKQITQLGNNNSVVDFSFNPDTATNLELVQDGNNLIFERFGTNELSKNLKFRMTGDARTIVIRSF
ncbi:hypothetical protein [Aquimarina spongiae]|uniref:Curlin associated repeat-containing protein n=1 Tax=Aquimarina spongiae TaxID=570521 RepID=A0A1M6HGY3_9FLAO|nr:hypothetical protein [Aquimarina spongiae]SHJ21379.1 hypothetical protein SAMN04488508_106275 [Aquimarina spongiae]